MHLKGNMGLIQPLPNRNVSVEKTLETPGAARRPAAVQLGGGGAVSLVHSGRFTSAFKGECFSNAA